MVASSPPEFILSQFLAGLSAQAIPDDVLSRAEDLFLDWIGAALAGKGARPVETLLRFSRTMGPSSGNSEILISRETSTPYFAAMVNAAASHMAEQDDVHNGAVFHPGTVVFPVALAIAQDIGSSGLDFLAAVVAGYEAGIRAGEFLGRSHYKTFHTTGTAGAIAAAVTGARLLGLSAAQMQHAIGSAGTQAAGLWEFLRDAADSKQLHTAHAAVAGLSAAYLARDGFTGAKCILTGPQGMAAGMSTDAHPETLTRDLGSRWALAETSFKFHASCRHTHPAADALQDLMLGHRLHARDIQAITAKVHQGAMDVLGTVTNPESVHQAKFSMGTVLGLIAVHGRAGLHEFDAHFLDPAVVQLRNCVTMACDPEVDGAYPGRWIGKVSVMLRDGRTLEGRIDTPKGDPGNTLDRQELARKATQLALYSGAATHAEMRTLCALVYGFRTAATVPCLMPMGTPVAAPGTGHPTT